MQRENKTEGEKYLKQAHGIGDIVAHPSLARNPNLIRINRRVRSRLLHSLVPIHLLRQNNFYNRKTKTKTTSEPCIREDNNYQNENNRGHRISQKAREKSISETKEMKAS